MTDLNLFELRTVRGNGLISKRVHYAFYDDNDDLVASVECYGDGYWKTIQEVADFFDIPTFGTAGGRFIWIIPDNRVLTMLEMMRS